MKFHTPGLEEGPLIPDHPPIGSPCKFKKTMTTGRVAAGPLRVKIPSVSISVNAPCVDRPPAVAHGSYIPQCLVDKAAGLILSDIGF